MKIKMWSTDQIAEGFTLLEMLITITIVTVIILVVGVSFSGLQGRKDLIDTTARLDALISEARMAAIKHAKTTSVVFDLQKRQWRSSTQDQWQRWPESIDISLVSARELGDETTSSVVFLSDGTSSGATIQLHTPSSNIVIRRIHWLTGAIHAE